MRARILPPTAANLRAAAERLLAGEVVAIPTETVYGLAGVAFDERAVARIFACKERPAFDPLIVHVPGLEGLAGVVARTGALVQALAGAFWPGPLTLVLPRAPGVPDLVVSGLPTVAVRSPRHPVAHALLELCGKPLAAPSANRFGRISPTTAEHVLAELGDRIDVILDGGSCDIGVESTIVAVADDGGLTLLRPGGVAVEDIARVAGAPVARVSPGRPAAPGMLPSHYAPRKQMILLPNIPEALPARVGLLAFAGAEEAVAAAFAARTGRQVIARVLSRAGNLGEAARNLFAALRALDDSEAELLFAEPAPSDAGLGWAINDRLRRAAGAG